MQLLGASGLAGEWRGSRAVPRGTCARRATELPRPSIDRSEAAPGSWWACGRVAWEPRRPTRDCGSRATELSRRSMEAAAAPGATALACEQARGEPASHAGRARGPRDGAVTPIDGSGASSLELLRGLTSELRGSSAVPRETWSGRRSGGGWGSGGGGRRGALALVLLLLQHAPEDLAGGGLGERLGELEARRGLLGGHVVARPAGELGLVDAAARGLLEYDDGLDGLAAPRVLAGDDDGFLDRGVGVEHRLDLGGPDLEAGEVGHALEAVDQEEVAFVVGAAEVAGAEEALAVDLDEAGGVGLGVVPVAVEDLRAVRDDLADLARR